jgi:hypothetical protein
MSARTSTTPVITSDIVRAFADALETGYTGSLNDFAGSPEGQAAATARADQENAKLRMTRQSAFRAVARDFRTNGQITTYSKERAQLCAAYLATVDWDAVPAPATTTTDDASEDTATTE